MTMLPPKPLRKKIVVCKGIEFHKQSNGDYIAKLIRTSPHPMLGEPTGRITLTSRILRIDFIKKLCETENTKYMWL